MKLKEGEYFTIEEMAKLTSREYKAVSKIIERAGHKPISDSNLYSEETYLLVKNTPGKGRPRKQPEPEPEKLEPTKPTKKGKK